MNVTRIAILGVAAVAAGAAALLVRGFLGGGTPAVEASLPPPTTTEQVLVAGKDITSGNILDADSVRWEEWPKGSVTDAFIKQSAQPDIAMAVEGIVVRQPLVTGEPVLETKIVRAGAAGFLAATIQPGMRGVSIPISAETSAGGFILPNDHVDVILTRDVTKGDKHAYATDTILRNVRVLAIDQASKKPGEDQEAVVGKTVTLELSQAQSERISEALVQAHQENGSLSLSLRALGDTAEAEEPEVYVEAVPNFGNPAPPRVTVFRYGVQRPVAPGTDGNGNPNDSANSGSPD